MKKAFRDFREFAFKGNVLDMAVGVMIGGAFGKIVASLVNDVIMPAISVVVGSVNFDSLFIVLDGNTYATLEQAREAGAPALAYGSFITTVIDFLIIALCIYIIVKLIARLRSAKEAPKAEKEPNTQCPYCAMEINAKAKRCPHCTSQLGDVNETL